MTTVRSEDILEVLRGMGLKPGDKFIFHSSLKSFGTVDGGADAVIDAMISSVQPWGTVFVPTMNFGNPFHPKTTESRVGLITETFRRRPNAIRSLHPSHSVTGIGPDAKRILADHEKTTPMGADSPLSRLARENGYVLLAGVTHTANSTVHAAFEMAKLPFLVVYRTVAVTQADGSTKDVRCMIPGCSQGFDKLEPILNDRKLQQRSRVGDSIFRLMKGRHLLEVSYELVKKDPAALLCDRPECEWCPEARRIIASS